MPGRQSHGGPPSKQPKGRVNNKKRSANALAIATQQNPESIKIRRHRLGDIEDDDRPAKRARKEEISGDDEDALSSSIRSKKALKGRFDELDIDAGSDSEGNEWHMGHADGDNDSDLDSDEAFGDSDEEKFEGFAFSGSSTHTKIKKKGKGAGSRDITLSEEPDDPKTGSAAETDGLGDDAIDLAAMLDATEEDPEEDAKESRERETMEGRGSAEELSGTETDSSADSSSILSMEENDEADTGKITAIQTLIAGLPQAEIARAPARQRNDGASEYNTPSNFGITSKAKLTLEDLDLPSIRDPFVRKSLKLLGAESKGGSTGQSSSGKLEVPLAKRQQDRLDRSAAYEKSKETLDKWTDTVKHNRRAEHLIFPLPDPDDASAKNNNRLQQTTNLKPFNELEATIKTILEESGLAAVNGKDDEDQMMEFEELEANKLSLQEVQARRAQLRIARDLLFREEARARRIKKIKSKSYRKVHRKQREKENQLSRQALVEAGIEPLEDEQEIHDRRRAEERMGAKHRDSKWSRATKKAGRAAWDEDARAGITEMARRNEELRKRVEGKNSRSDGARQSDSFDSESEDESSEDDDAEQGRLLRKLDGLGTTNGSLDSGPGHKLSNMKFMLKAEASRKRENDSAIEHIREDLVGEGSSDDGDNDIDEVGRRNYGPASSQVKIKETSHAQKFKSEFEEPQDSGDDDNVDIYTTSQSQAHISRNAPKKDPQKLKSHFEAPQTSKPDSITTAIGGGAWSRPASQKNISEPRRRKQKQTSTAEAEELDLSNVTVITKSAQAKKQLYVKHAALQTEDPESENDDDGDRDDTLRLPYAIRDQELIKRAFAGADVVGEFETEKRQTIIDEDEKVTDNTLPGWGNWVGDGVSKKDKRQHKGRFLAKSEGIKEQERKDAKLDRVIINEKRIKKNGKYLASNLPHPFETRQQYERSLRLPVGPEWTTKETFQDATKPRILMKQGIIAPMSKPLF